MSWREEDMYPYVWRNLRARYPAYDGWKIAERPERPGYEPDFTVERCKHGKIQRVVVEVKADCKVRKKYIRQLNDYVKSLQVEM